MDAISIKDIHHRYGSRKLKTYKTIPFWKYYFYYPFVKKITPVRPLNYIPYSKSIALAELQKRVGYKEYGRKHGESRFTKFFQNYYLPRKFNQDKRRPHLSSMILSGEITRDFALELLKLPLYDPVELKQDKAFVAKKLDITENQLDILIDAPGKSYRDYRNWDSIYSKLKVFQRFLKILNDSSINIELV